MEKTDRANDGFTLVEVVVGLLIFAIAASTVFAVVGQGYLMMSKARDLTRVSQIIQYQTENLRGTAFPDLEKLVGTKMLTVNEQGVPIGEGKQSVPPFNFREFQLYQVVSQEESDLCRLVLFVRWKDSSGKVHTRSNFTYFTEKGLNEYYIRTSS